MESTRTDCCNVAAIATRLSPLANHPGWVLGRDLRPQGSVGGAAMVLSTEISRLVIFMPTNAMDKPIILRPQLDQLQSGP